LFKEKKTRYVGGGNGETWMDRVKKKLSQPKNVRKGYLKHPTIDHPSSQMETHDDRDRGTPFGNAANNMSSNKTLGILHKSPSNRTLMSPGSSY
jgi:hypothetical protein